jgi:hypothetical protein
MRSRGFAGPVAIVAAGAAFLLAGAAEAKVHEAQISSKQHPEEMTMTLKVKRR